MHLLLNSLLRVVDSITFLADAKQQVKTKCPLLSVLNYLVLVGVTVENKMVTNLFQGGHSIGSTEQSHCLFERGGLLSAGDELYKTVLSIIVAMLYIKSSDLIHCIVESLYPLSTIPCSYLPHSLAPGNHIFTLCFYEFNFFLDTMCK